MLVPSRNQGAARNYPDLITHLLVYLLSLVPSITMTLDDVAVISRQISLALVGVIILSSMRMLLRGVTRVSPSFSEVIQPLIRDSRHYASQVATLERP